MDQVVFKDCLPQILLGPFLNTLTKKIVFYVHRQKAIPKQLTLLQVLLSALQTLAFCHCSIHWHFT